MPSQFFGLNIGASALSAFQTSVNTAANNVANVQTKGYTRQTANASIGTFEERFDFQLARIHMQGIINANKTLLSIL